MKPSTPKKQSSDARFLELELEIRKRLWKGKYGPDPEKEFAAKINLPWDEEFKGRLIGRKIRWEFIRKHKTDDFSQGKLEVTLNDAFLQIPGWERDPFIAYMKQQVKGDKPETNPHPRN